MERLHEAKKLASEIGCLIAAEDLPGSDRAALAGACYHIALDHHEAIIRLIEAGVHVSALALVRAQVEACIRGAWLHHVANNDEIGKIREDKEFPNQWRMIADLETLDMFPDKILSTSHKANWSQLHGLVHPGAALMAMVLKDGHVVRNCDEKYLISALNYTSIHALLAAAGIAILADNQKAISRFLEIMADWARG